MLNVTLVFDEYKIKLLTKEMVSLLKLIIYKRTFHTYDFIFLLLKTKKDLIKKLRDILITSNL